MSIGEFARRSRLSPEALRFYDGLGLLPPARVDELSGYARRRRPRLPPRRARIAGCRRAPGPARPADHPRL